MRQIKLSNHNGHIIVDDEDYHRTNMHIWTISFRSGKPATITTKLGGVKTITIGRFILNYEGENEVDHRDRNKFNNQRNNLRIATGSQNVANNIYFNPTGYRGIRKAPSGRYEARIKIDKLEYHLGTYETPEKAAKAYDIKAIEYYGEFAILNFQQEVKE